MNEMLNNILTAIDTALQHGAALSIILGLVVAICGTQYVKRLEVFPSKKWWIRALALPLGFCTTFFTWPIHELNAVRFFLALAVGLIAPLVYQGVTLALYWKWPQLEKRLSAAPSDTSP